MSKTVLVAPLNWGLGHAARCVPIINALLQNHKVILASDGVALDLLKLEFPNLEYEVLPSYGITYPENGSFLGHIAKQVPRILKTINSEKKLLPSLIKKHGIDMVISDNRYGIHHESVKSVFITHQIVIPTPFAEKILAKLQQQFLVSFDEIWVPDVKTVPNISGKLAHNEIFPDKAKYIGLLSRFNDDLKAVKPETMGSEDFVLGIVSGPEPMRTHFENLLIDELSGIGQKVVLVGGVSQGGSALNGANMTYFPFLGMNELKWLIMNAKQIVSRSGYSTVMDLLALNKTAIFVPTPGQTEQEYLGDYLMKNGLFYTVVQDEFNWSKVNIGFKEWTQQRAPITIENKNELLEIINRI